MLRRPVGPHVVRRVEPYPVLDVARVQTRVEAAAAQLHELAIGGVLGRDHVVEGVFQIGVVPAFQYVLETVRVMTR